MLGFLADTALLFNTAEIILFYAGPARMIFLIEKEKIKRHERQENRKAN